MGNSQTQRSKERVPEKSQSRESALSNIISLVLTGDLVEFKNR